MRCWPRPSWRARQRGSAGLLSTKFLEVHLSQVRAIHDLLPRFLSFRAGWSFPSYTFPGYVLVCRLTRHHRNARVGRERNRRSSWHRTSRVGRKDDYVRTGRQYEPVGATGWNRFGGDGFSWKTEVLTSSTVWNPRDAAPEHDHSPFRMAGRRCSQKRRTYARTDLA